MVIVLVFLLVSLTGIVSAWQPAIQKSYSLQGAPYYYSKSGDYIQDIKVTTYNPNPCLALAVVTQVTENRQTCRVSPCRSWSVAQPTYLRIIKPGWSSETIKALYSPTSHVSYTVTTSTTGVSYLDNIDPPY